MPRRFPAPWRVEKIPGGYVVRDATGQTLAYVSSRATQEGEARLLADCIARLPRLGGK
jgi:hypothetical protein